MSSARTVLTTIPQLVAAGLIGEDRAPALEEVAARYAVATPRGLLDLWDPSDPDDPVALQYLPHESERLRTPDELDDPIGDHLRSPVEGVVHRYPDRVLLMPTTLCAVYCRFCFRRETVGPGGTATLGPEALEAALSYIASRNEIVEVILTGGDPLVLSARRLDVIFRRLADMTHVRAIRVHTRIPVAAPEKVTADLIRALQGAGRPLTMAVHVNHSRELGPGAQTALGLLADAQIPLLSQTVLLKGVNDDVEVLAALMRRLVELRVRPYYLHHPDMAPGTARFRLSLDAGRALAKGLRRVLPVFCQPTYVLDVPGGLGKTPVAGSRAKPLGDGRFAIDTPLGGVVVYPPEERPS